MERRPVYKAKDGYMRISADVPKALNLKRKILGMSWTGIINQGFKMIELAPKINQFEDAYKKLEEKQRKTAELLGKYAQQSAELQ